MKLIVIYGPPAVGKLTTGKELARRTGFKLFHNHLTVDDADAVFPERSDWRDALLKKLRIDEIELAAEAGVNVIFTVAHSAGLDDYFMAKLVKTVESHGGEVGFVQLTAPEDVLVERIQNSSRREVYGKMTNPDHLKRRLKERDHTSPVNFSHNLVIDTNTSPPEQTASEIISYFNLIEVPHER